MILQTKRTATLLSGSHKKPTVEKEIPGISHLMKNKFRSFNNVSMQTAYKTGTCYQGIQLANALHVIVTE